MRAHRLILPIGTSQGCRGHKFGRSRIGFRIDVLSPSWWCGGGLPDLIGRLCIAISCSSLRRLAPPILLWPFAMAAHLRGESPPPQLGYTDDQFSVHGDNSLPTRLDTSDPVETKCFREDGVLKVYYRIGKKRLAPAYPNEGTLKGRLDKIKMLMMFERVDRAYVWDNLRDMMDGWDYEDMVDFAAAPWTFSGHLSSDPLLRPAAGSRIGEPTASVEGEPFSTAAARPPLPNPDPGFVVGTGERAMRTCTWTAEAAEARRATKRLRKQLDT